MPAPTILVVDDDPVILDLVGINFELEGSTALRAAVGVDGLERGRSGHPDVIVADVMMPRCSGLELLSTVKADPVVAHIPVVLLSDLALATDVTAGLDAGADDYVTKPFDPDDLLARVDKLLGR